MLDRENFDITVEQRARITRNFRAAKALLARKRPRLQPHDPSSSSNRCNNSSHSLPRSSGVLNSNGIRTLGNATGVERRIPFAGIPTNIPSANSLHEIKSIAIEDGSNGCVLDIYKTPIKEQAICSLDDAFFAPSVLDDDFDHSILEEIDALCEEKSLSKAERQGPEVEVESQNNDGVSGDISIASESSISDQSIRTESTSCSGNRLELGVEGGDSLAMLNETMPVEYSRYFGNLNERQREAACSDISIPLMIVAGPGSGKTSTIVGRVLMLLNKGIDPSNVLAMTFTTAAASEMRDRIGAVAGKATAKELTISTFHSFSLQLCRLHAEKLGRTSEFLIYGHAQQRRAIIEAVRLSENGKKRQECDDRTPGEDSNNLISPEHFKDGSKKWQKFITQAKASGKIPEECSRVGDQIGAAILGNYNEILKSCNALDYHDLISCSLKLLTDFPEVFKECQDSWKAIVIDEFQDTSAMQYNLLRVLASHKHLTVVGDDDQSIFSFNGADISGFDSFRKDFPNYKETRLNKNYRSTWCIVEAASYLIQNNQKRCQLKGVQTDNSSGSKIAIKECHSEETQCAFVIDKVLEIALNGSTAKCFGKIAVLYRRQITGKIFQTAFLERKIPFNVHGVAFYRKKVVKTIIAMLRTALPDCDDDPYRRVFKALLPFEKAEKKRVVDHIEKVSTIRKCSFLSAASVIFCSKLSGTLKRSQLTQGRKVLSTIEMISKLVQREQSVSAVIISLSNMIPRKYLLEQMAVVDVDGGKLLNEDNDIRSVLQYLQDDVSDFLRNHFSAAEGEREVISNDKGCLQALKSFIEFISKRERENFHSRRRDNENSVTLTTIHQSKGLEWDVVFIVKANESEIPLLHEFNGISKENGTSIEEERRLLYVAMTRAREKLLISYVVMDSNFQMIQPSRFLREIPDHLREVQAELSFQDIKTKHSKSQKGDSQSTIDLQKKLQPSEVDMVLNDSLNIHVNEDSKEFTEETMEMSNGNSFLRRFAVEERAVVSHLFHQWAKKQAFQDPKRLLDKVGFVIDERLRVKKNKSKEVLCALKLSLNCDEAFHYAEYVLRWEQIPADRRVLMMQEKQEHFLKNRMKSAMASAAPTPKQVSYLQNLGCTVVPTSRLHASSLIEQYKSL